ncbi:unnamed protein product [Nippostrongylus brasiliensis]|uniref:Glucosylceramidase n=1 Tax=Nippostrongylus brasiliensis TaxID=27835 RepID=A0A0N4XIQ3_NIPBR|nr:unnamed protein product [Nippostrongylus brasiliensis]
MAANHTLEATTQSFTYRPCVQRSFGKDLIVCVCNITYCDNIEPVGDLRSGQAVMYYSDQTGSRLVKSDLRQTSIRAGW